VPSSKLLPPAFKYLFTRNVLVESLILVFRIREVASSNPDMETGCLGTVFDFLSPLGECQDNTLKLGYDHFLPNAFQTIIHLSPFHLMQLKSVVK
jgi:hypothetical protein